MSGRRTALAARRAAMGHTQESLAGLLRIERSTVTRWERGKSTPQPWVRRELAGALSVTIDALDELLTQDEPERERDVPLAAPAGNVPSSVVVPGRERSGSSVQSGTVRAQLPALRRVLDAHDLPEDGPVRPLSELRQVVLGAVRRRLDSDYSHLVTELPALLPELTRALLLHTGQRRAEIARLLAQTYRAADAIADKFGYYDLSARIIGHMGWAAAESGDELSIATASYVRAETFFANGDLDTGRRMLERAAERLMPDSSIDAAAAYGALHMRAAVTAARAGRTMSAGDHLAEARRVARRVPEGVYCGTAFGPASVHIHHVTLSVDLGDADSALRAALGWAPPIGLPAERRSHYYVDLARAQLQAGRQHQALASLIAARAIAPEHIHEHPDVRGALSSLLHTRMAQSSQVLDFARWVGLPDFAS